MIYVDVILPLPLSNVFTFEVPVQFDTVQIGCRVVVQFGKKKIYTALVYKIHDQQPEGYIVKPILDIVDDFPVVNQIQLKFWKWLASYYCCGLGEVMNVALPNSIKLSSESVFVMGKLEVKASSLNDNEFLIIEALKKYEKLTVNDVISILNTKKIFPILNNLINNKTIVVHEELNESYKPKVKRFVRLLNFDFDVEKLKKSKKQYEIYLFLKDYFKNNNDDCILLKKIILNTNCSYSSVKALETKNIICFDDLSVDRIEKKSIDLLPSVSLSNSQQLAFDSINNFFLSKDVVLLHGVTSSGKTEVYVKLIEQTIQSGQQVLYLLPEIALTTQIINRLRLYFGDKIGVYHSKFNKHERAEIWEDIRRGNRYSVIIGARSSLFLPFNNLGCIIVDEEHENTFKQFQPNPKYHARDSAIVYANMLGAKVLLGSATPSIESYHNSLNNKYGLVELKERYGSAVLPEVQIIDLKYLKHRKQLKSSFSDDLIAQIKIALNNSEQIILFQNRRGFAPVNTCSECGWIAQCKSCDVSLTLHKKNNLLKCHYCGFSSVPITKCKVCGNNDISEKGFGTEKIEEELSVLLPHANIKRMDLDTTSKKNAHQSIINDFENRKIDILIGTQMVTKGLDFANVSIVGVINADNMLNFPDFRSHERSFNLMVQVAGRAGRKNHKGKVIIQTYSADHEIIEAVTKNDFLQMYETQLSERKLFNYPPFCKLIQITISHRNFDITNHAARDFALALRKSFGSNVLGPEYPLVSRIKNLHLKNILLKVDDSFSNTKVKGHLLELVKWIKQRPNFKSIKVTVDVDPV